VNGKLEFSIHGTLPNMNDIIDAKARTLKRRGKNVTTAYTKMKSEQTAMVMSLAATAKREGNRLGKAFVVLHHFEPNKRRDHDNVHAGARKFILDGLVKARVLSFKNKKGETKHGDGWAAVAPTILAFFDCDPDMPRIEVQVFWGNFGVHVKDLDEP
jgi:hypothetical protein